MAKTRAEEKFIKDLGARLRQIREQKGWTLEQTEEHGWHSWRHLQRIESGKNVTVVTLHRLAQLYSVNISDLFDTLKRQ